MADIFLSYASEDRERIRPLVAALEAQGWSVWWDREIHAGPQFRRVIEEEIGRAACVVVAWSESAIKSDWVMDEADDGRERSILVPLLLDDVRPPMGFRSAQTANLVGWPERRSGAELDTLITGIRNLLGAPEPRTQTGDHAASVRAIVVLPFDNMSSDPGDAYLAAGLTEEITADLAGLHELRVVSRTTAQQYRNTDKSVPSIARELAVQYVIEGSVRKAGEQLRITCQLIDAISDSQLWVNRYAGSMAEVFDLQERVARSIAKSLQLQLSPEEERQLAARPIADAEAYELYLKARQAMNTFTAEGLESARSDLQRALAITGENARLYAKLGDVHYQFWNTGTRLEDEDLRLAREYSDRSLALDPHSSDHLLVKGLLEITGGNAVKSLAYFDAILDRDPLHEDALMWSTAGAMYLGLEIEAKSRLERLRDVNPQNPLLLWGPVWIEMLAGRFASALEIALSSRAEHQSVFLLECACAMAYASNGHRQEAYDLIQASTASEPSQIGRLFRALGCAYIRDHDGVLALLDSELKLWAEKDFGFAAWVAEALAEVGEVEQALDWLETAVERGNVNYPYLSELDPFLASVRGIPRFETLMERVKSEWDALLASRAKRSSVGAR